MVCDYSKASTWEKRKKPWEEMSGLPIWYCWFCVGTVKAFLPICGWSQSRRKKITVGTLLLEVRKHPRECRDISCPAPGWERRCSQTQTSFHAIVLPKEFKTLNNQVSNPSSLEEELLKDRVWGGKWGHKFPYLWDSPQWLTYTSGIIELLCRWTKYILDFIWVAFK